jgi:hypothetical protein
MTQLPCHAAKLTLCAGLKAVLKGAARLLLLLLPLCTERRDLFACIEGVGSM